MNLRKQAKGRPCMVRIPGVCTRYSETVVLAHLNNKSLFGVGMGLKPNDIFASWTCSACHDVLDRRIMTDHTDEELEILHYEGVFRTQNQLLKEGKIGVK